MADIRIEARVERFPIAGSFTISRGSKREAVVVVAEVTDGLATGRGEAVPYARYGETVDGVLGEIRAATASADPAGWTGAMKPGAARNAVDCALLDLAAKRQRTTVAALLGLAPVAAVQTCYTLSLDHPEAMADRAAAVPRLPILKLKLGGEGDEARLRAVRAARPDARLVADANEAWRVDMLDHLLGVSAECRVELIEQPLPAGDDEALRGLARPVPVCADESFHTRADLERVAPLYDAVNIKLDKAGGLTEALATVQACRACGLDVMLGCMVGTSLAMAPALLLAGAARWVDLDGPLLLAEDRPGGLEIQDGLIRPPAPGLWG